MKDKENNPLFKPRYEDGLPSVKKHVQYLEENKEYIQVENKYEYIANYRKNLLDNLQAEVERISEKAYTILKDLKEKHVITYENEEVMGFKGKKVHIELPAVGEFKGYNFDYFVSYNKVSQTDFDNKPKLQKSSYSMEKIGELLKNINHYMKAMGVKTDGNMNYKYALDVARRVYFGELRCKAGDCLKFITGLNETYWLSDDLGLAYDVSLACYETLFYFRTEFLNESYLFLDPSQT